VQNKSGAGGGIGSAAVAKAAPDGYTLLIGTGGSQVTGPLTAKSSPFGVGVVRLSRPRCLIGATPLPNPPPQGGREHTEFAARADPISLRSALVKPGSIGPLHGKLQRACLRLPATSTA
jgi:Tripartite tricarboxylate transporter family receptor